MATFASVAPPKAPVGPWRWRRRRPLPQRPRPPAAAAQPDCGQHARLKTSQGATGSATASIWRWPADILAVVPAAGADPEMQAQLAASQRAAAQGRELLADSAHGAWRASRRPMSRERARNTRAFTRAPRSRARPPPRRAKDRRLGEQQRGALLLGQLAQVGEQPAQVGPRADLLGQARGGSS